MVVRATNKLGYVHTIPSDGVTVKLEPLLPGNVRDGDITGKDLNYQPSVTSLSANWDGFGQPQEDSNKPVVSRTLLLNIITLSFSTRQHILSYSSNNLRTVIRLFCSKLVEFKHAVACVRSPTSDHVVTIAVVVVIVDIFYSN